MRFVFQQNNDRCATELKLFQELTKKRGFSLHKMCKAMELAAMQQRRGA
ncbi:MAG: hypothetical protein LBQ33_02050 [Oscillospiraceae bacterium]|nr:hypothetical protein [Oscillospiraceae bacterium]